MLRYAVALLCVAACAQAEDGAGLTRLLRYPDVSASQIAFVHGGDVWVVGRDGGNAQRLTSHAGAELYPKFSPDGRWLAFSAEYSGTRQVWVIAAAGGTPRQLTWYSDVGALPPRGGTDYRVLDWTPDGRHVIVRANRLPYDERGGRPYRVPFEGGLETPLPMPESGGGSLSPDGTKFVYTPIDADFRGWKRYRGGRAPDLWIYDLVGNSAQQLTTFRGLDLNPAWVGDTIYFSSDRDYTANLYAIAPSGGEPRKLTAFDDFDVLWPSGGPDAVVFEQGGWIWRYDAGAAAAVKVPIVVPSDAPYTLPVFKKVAAQIESFGLAPGGERAVFGARGEIFTVPAKHGEPRNVSRTPAEREIAVSWSPDGRSIAYLSDASGEYEICVRAQDGRGAARRITSDGGVWRYPPVWSPDSKKLAFADKRVRLRWVEVASGRVHEVDQASHDDITEYAWSPDSRWLAYTKTDATRMQAIWLHALESGRNTLVTGRQSHAYSPAFDPKGRYLYFLSNRDYAGLTFSGYEFDYLYVNPTRIYAATLAADGEPLGRPRSDEVGGADAGSGAGDGNDEGDAGKAKAESKPPTPLRVDLDGFADRVVALDVPAGAYQGLAANADGVFVVAGNPQAGQLTLKHYALADATLADVASGITGYALSADGRKLLLRLGEAFAIVEAKAGQNPDKAKLALDRLELRIDPRVEWQQMYVDAWRILRDWFYEPNLHGGLERWQAVRARYAPLVAHVRHRSDLDYIFHEVAGEANAGHVYVQQGDEPKLERKAGGFLGAEFEAHGSGYFRIAKVFAGENWDAANRSPLTEPGVGVGAGEFLIAVDGVDARSVANPYALLENKAERLVELSVNTRPSAAGARRVAVRTLASERNLRYLDWVQSRRALVERLAQGRIGYLHLPNTAVEGNRELNKWYAPLAHKQALIIDDRYNGGGFIPDRMIEILARTPLNYWKRRGLEPQATPALVHDGPKAMLINGLSSSGGDALPYYFRKRGLGALIGTRTWGGLIGISGNPTLADGGAILAATFRFLDTDNRWAVENEGVAPDIEVVDRPELVAQGRDPSLEVAVEHLLKELERHPPRKPVAPPAPTEFR
jgi:tricorn protease